MKHWFVVHHSPTPCTPSTSYSVQDRKEGAGELLANFDGPNAQERAQRVANLANRDEQNRPHLNAYLDKKEQKDANSMRGFLDRIAYLEDCESLLTEIYSETHRENSKISPEIMQKMENLFHFDDSE